MTSPHDPFDRLRPEITPLEAPAGTHDAVLRRAGRRRVRTATITASAAAVVALVVAVPLVVVAGGTSQQVADQAPTTSPVPTVRSSAGTPTPTAPPASSAPAPTTASSVPQHNGPTGPVPPDFAPASVTFISAQDGWTLGHAPCPEVPCTSVARTDDGGSSWVGTPAPRTDRVTGTAGVDKIRFGSPTDGWAFGGELWSTHDGSTWDKVPLPVGQAALSLAADRSRVVAGIGTGCDTTATRTGTCQQTVLEGAGSGGGDLTPLPGASTLPGRAEVTLAGATVWATSVNGGTTTLVRGASDGSSDVTPLTTSCSQNTARAALAASSATDLTLACTSTGSADAQVFASSNAGGDWHRVGSVTLTGALTSIAAAGPSSVLVSDDGGGVQLSTDGGASFSTVLHGSGFSFVGFTSSSQGVALPATPGVGDLRITRDGGTSWTRLNVS